MSSWRLLAALICAVAGLAAAQPVVAPAAAQPVTPVEKAPAPAKKQPVRHAEAVEPNETPVAQQQEKKAISSGERVPLELNSRVKREEASRMSRLNS
jgi:hypothetical protein